MMMGVVSLFLEMMMMMVVVVMLVLTLISRW